ncbi:glycosyltransferase family 32 protein [Tenacibaculum sp. TC6]|uniref:glycosyltransferase family 32 protein n=1 Tax=Tenacibaculum sp. TC6 TaxID=3423223 RepID=UPI003D36DC54
MIPKIIHFCWYGNGEFNDLTKKCITSWKERLPDYTIKIWNEENTPFDKLPFLKLLYKQKKWAFVSDYMRLYALYKEGGVYLDTDIEILKRFDDLHKKENFTGFQTDMDSSPNPIGAGIIGAKKGSKFILDCIKETEIKQRLKFNAMGSPIILTKVLKNYGLSEYKTQEINDVLVLEKEYFYPYYINEEFTQDCVRQETICIHWWEYSWKNKEKGFNYYLDSITRKLQKLPLLLLEKLVYLFKGEKFYYINNKI